jgi:hypothetical protein
MRNKKSSVRISGYSGGPEIWSSAKQPGSPFWRKLLKRGAFEKISFKKGCFLKSPNPQSFKKGCFLKDIF